MGGMPPRNFEFAFSPERERGEERELPEKEIGVKGYRVVPPLDLMFIRKQHPVHFLRDKNIKRSCTVYANVSNLFLEFLLGK